MSFNYSFSPKLDRIQLFLRSFSVFDCVLMEEIPFSVLLGISHQFFVNLRDY